MGIKSILHNRTVRNAGWIIGGQVINKLLSFLMGVLSARYLGPGNYGLINYAAAYTTFFASVCTLGINSIIVKDFMEKPQDQGQAIGTTLVLRVIASVLSGLMIVLLVSFVDRDEPTTILVVALSSIGLLFQIFDTLNYWFQSRLQSKYCAIATVLSYVIVSGYKLLLLVTGKSVAWFAVATAIEYMVTAVFLLLAYKKNGGVPFSFSLSKAKALLSSSGSFIISGLMVSIYASTDKLMLKQMLDETSVGHYSLAVSLSTIWAFVLKAVIDSVYPSIVQAHSKDHEAFQRKNRQLYALVFYSAAAVSLAIALLAEPIVTILYGEHYLPAVQPLRITIWYTAFSYLGYARNAWVVCENRQKYLKYISISAALINVALNWLLIPLWGASGAALASLITQVSTIAVLPVLIRPLRPNAKLMVEAVFFRDVFPKAK